jgi:hypothetical protein
MLSPNQMLRLFVEFIFVLLGAMLLWLDLAGKLFVDRHSWSWLALGVAMVLWGARALMKPGANWAPGERWIRGSSLLLLGGVMLVTSRAPFPYVRALMATLAVVLILRGVAGAGLSLRAR